MARYRVGLETRERILDATRELLGEVGFEGTTLKAISKRAGIGAGSFYNLFDSKDAVILEVVREAINAVDPDPSGLGRESVADLVEAFVRFITDEPVLARIYIQLAIAGGLTDDRLRARVLRHHDARVERFADAMAREAGVESSDGIADRAEALLACLTGLAITWLLKPGFDFEGNARHLLTDDVIPVSAPPGPKVDR